MPRWDALLPSRVPSSKLLLSTAMLNTVAFSGIHSVGILKDAKSTPKTITINIPMHRLMADADNAPMHPTLSLGRNCST